MEAPSYWFIAVPDEKRFPSLEGNLRFDACVVGGGIAGISAAYFLARAGIQTCLLELGHLVTGDSGFTTAFATHFLDSVEATTQAWQASDEGIALFKATIAAEAISCDWQDVDAIGFTRKPDPTALHADARAFRQSEPMVEVLGPEAATGLLGFPVSAAYRLVGREGQFHIRKFLLGLADAASRRGAKLFEESAATGFELGTQLRVTTDKGSITCDWLVVATPPPRQFFPVLAEKLRGAITYVIQAWYPEPAFGPGLFWDDLDPYHYFRWVSRNDLILGGEDYWLRGKRPEGDAHAKLEAWLAEISGKNAPVVGNKWQGALFYSPDILPCVGSHPAYGQRVIFTTAWAGNGMVHGFLAGTIAADVVQKKEHPYLEIFSPARYV